jgi:hypothetical protein
MHSSPNPSYVVGGSETGDITRETFSLKVVLKWVGGVVFVAAVLAEKNMYTYLIKIRKKKFNI